MSMLQLFLEVDEEIAEALVGEEMEFEEPAPPSALPAPPPKPPAEEPEEVIAEDAPEANDNVRQAIAQGQIDAQPKGETVTVPSVKEYSRPIIAEPDIKENVVRQFLEVLQTSMFDALQGSVVEALRQPVIDAYQNSVASQHGEALSELTEALKEPVNITVQPAPVQVTNEVDVNVPEVNVVVTPVPGPAGEQGPAGPEGPAGEAV